MKLRMETECIMNYALCQERKRRMLPKITVSQVIKVTARTSKGEGNSTEQASGRESIVIWNVILGLLE